MLQVVKLGWVSGGSEVSYVFEWMGCMRFGHHHDHPSFASGSLDTVPCTFCLWGSELTRCVAVLLLLVWSSGPLGPLLSIDCAASEGRI